MVGELCISGMGVLKGYVNCVDFMKEKFIENLFKLGEMFYCIGDLVCWLLDGMIEYVGCIDD